MDSAEYIALQAEAKGKKLDNKWNAGWSYSTGTDIKRITDQCESLYNTDAEVANCVKQRTSTASGAGSGAGKGINWQNVGQSAQQFLSGLMAGKQDQNTPVYTNINYEPPRRNNTWIWVALGIGVVGGAIWYFAARKK